MAGLNTAPTETPAFPGRIALPYTLTAGAAAATFVAELANRRIVGARLASGRVLVPAQDFCGRTGEEPVELLEMPTTGTLSAFTETHEGVIGLVRVDGADTDMAHRIVEAAYDELAVGQRVEARWVPEASGAMTDLAGFAPGGEAGGTPQPLVPRAQPIPVHPYEIDLRYQHAYGPYYGRLFDELSTSRRILGVRCPSCEHVLVPPRELCETCFVRTGEWVDVADTGVLQAFSVIHLEFVGQKRTPPYVYAEIILDGASTRLIHTIGGFAPEEANERLAPGTRVRAVWRDGEPTGTLEDIEHFEVIES